MGKVLKKKLVHAEMSSTVGKMEPGQKTCGDGNVIKQGIKEVKSGSSGGKLRSSDASTSTIQQRDNRSGEAVAGCGVQSADKMAKDFVERWEKEIKRYHSRRDREVLRGALHLLYCDGVDCDNDRFCLVKW